MNISKLPLISCIHGDSIDLLIKKLEADEFEVFKLEGKGIRNGKTFFDEAIRSLPLDPPLSGKVNWDAFSDSLWGGLEQTKKTKVAIIWTGVNHILDQSLNEFLIAIDCFQRVASSLADPKSGVLTTKKCLIFLVGNGASFKPL